MSDHDDLVERRYRELRREVPSAALDKKVLGAARSAVAPRSVASRWAAPLALAAVLVLAVGVTLQMQHDERKRAATPQQEAAPASAGQTSPEPARLAPASPLSAAAPAASPAPEAARPAAPQEIPFAPRRPVEGSSAGAGPASVEANTTANPLGSVAKSVSPAAADLLRAQREAAQAVGSFGMSGVGAAPADPMATPPAPGPFSIDQATTTGVKVQVVNPEPL